MLVFLFIEGMFLIIGFTFLIIGYRKYKTELKQLKKPGQPFDKKLWRKMFYNHKEMQYGFYSLGTAGLFGSIYKLYDLFK